jgi:hypothetical protein
LKVIPVHGVWVYRRTTQRDTGANDDIDVRGQGTGGCWRFYWVVSGKPGERVKR